MSPEKNDPVANDPPKRATSAARTSEGGKEQEQSDLLDQFYVSLRCTYVAAANSEFRTDIRKKLDELFQEKDANQTWRNAYEIEQLLCFVMTESQLDIELARRVQEAKTLKVPYNEIVEQQIGKTDLTVDGKRELFQRLLNDIQWYYAKREQYRATTKLLMNRVSALLVVALVGLFLVV